MKKNNTGTKKANENKGIWEFSLKVIRHRIDEIQTENPSLVNVYDSKGKRIRMALKKEWAEEYKGKEGYKVRPVDNKKMIIILEEIVKFLENEI